MVSVSVSVGVEAGTPTEGTETTVITEEQAQAIRVGATGAQLIEGTGGEPYPVTFYIMLDKVYTQPVTVSYVINPGLATPLTEEGQTDYDYYDGSYTGTITIPAGYVGFAVTEFINPDFVVEGNEDFNITLVSAVGATINPNASTAVVTIIDDDAAVVSLTASPAEITEAGAGVVYTATLTGAVFSTNVTVTLSNGETITIAAGQTSGSVPYTFQNSDDVYVDPSSAPVTITSASAGEFSGKLTVNSAPATVAIIDTFNTTTATLSGPAEVLEGTGVIYTVTLDNAVRSGDAPVVVTLSNGVVITIASGLTGSNATPYTGPNLSSVTIATVTQTPTTTSPGLFEALDKTGTVNTDFDSTPTIGDESGTVDESALPEVGSGGGTVTATGTLDITTGNDSIAAVRVGGVNVTNGGTVTSGDNGTLVVTVANGVYSWTYTLNSATQEHTTPGKSADGVTDSYALEVEDSDGDKEGGTLTVTINDDIPDVEASTVMIDGEVPATLSVSLDESVGGDRGGDGDGAFDDTQMTAPFGSVSTQVYVAGSDAETEGDQPIQNAVANLFQIDTENYGADGAGGLTHEFGLVLSGADKDGFVKTTLTINDGTSIYLYQAADGSVTGYVGNGVDDGGPTGAVALTVGLSDPTDPANVQLTIEQYIALNHGDDDNDFDSAQLLTLIGEGASLDIAYTATITDADGDTDSSTAMSNLANVETSSISFEDDGPSITVSTVGTADALVVDETVLETNATANFADNFGNTPSYGADGAGTVTSAYTLGVKSAGVDSGLNNLATRTSCCTRTTPRAQSKVAWAARCTSGQRQ